MPEITPRRRWIKLWTQETLYGSTTSELTPEQIGVWHLLLCMAGDSPDPGKICIAPNIGMTREQIALILKISPELLESTEKALLKHNKISKNGTGVIEINNFIKYQGFDKTIHNKIYMRDYRARQKQVSLTSKPDSNGDDSKSSDSNGDDSNQTEQNISYNNRHTTIKEGGGDEKKGNILKENKDNKENSSSGIKEKELQQTQENIYSLYEKFVGTISPGIADKLKVAENEYKIEWIIYAFNEASDNNVKTWRYIETILEDCKNRGCIKLKKNKTKNQFEQTRPIPKTPDDIR